MLCWTFSLFPGVEGVAALHTCVLLLRVPCSMSWLSFALNGPCHSATVLHRDTIGHIESLPDPSHMSRSASNDADQSHLELHYMHVCMAGDLR